MTKTTKIFIRDAKAVHGDRYDYSKSIYLGCKKKIEVVCKIHGSFWKWPSDHTSKRGSGCPDCGCKTTGDALRMSKEEFIEKAKQTHGNEYDYSKVNYIGSREKVEIICKIHGSFWQQGAAHIHLKEGCPDCGCEKISKTKTKTLEEFIHDAKNTHGDKYDYSKSIYYGSHYHVEIVCKIHGSFWQSPSNHTNNETGCPDCAVLKITKTQEEFLREACANHEDKYDYSKTIYTTAHDKIEIICKIHGSFWQIAWDHINGSGCSMCANEKITVREGQCRLIFQRIFNREFPSSRPDFLVNPRTGRKLELDGYDENLKLAFECNGKQHYEIMDLFDNTAEKLDKTKERDEIKKKICEEMGIKLVIIPYWIRNMEEYIRKELGLVRLIVRKS